MGLRSAIKDRVKGVLGLRAEEAPVASAAPRARSSAVEASAPTAPASAEAARAAPPPPAPLPPKALSPEEAEKQAKIAAHFEKARKGVLKHLAEGGGRMSMGDMHDYSERRYFVAHQGFSRMMEGFVAEGLIDYNAAIGEATITDAGRDFFAR